MNLQDKDYQLLDRSLCMDDEDFSVDYDSMTENFQCFGDDAVFGLLYSNIKKGQVMLDIGIGTGLGSYRFKDLGVTIDGMDLSESMLDQCRRKDITRDLIVHDMTEVPYPYGDGAYDHVISVGVLHFFKDIRGIFEEVGRILKTGGKFTFTVMADSNGGPVGGPTMHHTRWGRDVVHHGREHVEKVLGEVGLKKIAWLLFVGSIDPENDEKYYCWAFVTEKL